MRGISLRLRRLVEQRARNRCEYCQLAQEGQPPLQVTEE
jgi:hypothetical protein